MKVFLSSTGRDLKTYRDAAFRAIEGLGLQCVRMEDFHFAALKIEDFDDQRIADCDLFVIILGHLHGTCPEGSEKSYTELEYETAVKLDKPRFLFVAHEDLPLLPSLGENDAKYARQRTFREQAVKGSPPGASLAPETHSDLAPASSVFLRKSLPRLAYGVHVGGVLGFLESVNAARRRAHATSHDIVVERITAE